MKKPVSEISKWSSLAQKRFDQIESGNDITFSQVFVPFYQQILSQWKGMNLLEVGCGTGHLARLLLEWGFQLSAIEPASEMFSLAIRNLKDTNCKVFNATMEDFNVNQRFDICMAHLCVNSVRNVSQFFKCVSEILEEAGKFIFAIPHPCFWNDSEAWIDVKVFDYVKEIYSENNKLKLTLSDQELEGVPYFHRPLGFYFSELKDAGFCITDFFEIMPPEHLVATYGAKWKKPRFCVFLAQKIIEVQEK